MRIKPVPAAPADLDTVRAARRAVPLIPGSEADCCARLMTRLDIPNRDDAGRWLTLLRGLGLVEEGPSGFTRTRGEFDREGLRAAFVGGVFGAEEVLSILDEADGALSAATVFDRFEPTVPPWERHRYAGAWRDVWRERVGRLLDWLVLLGAAASAPDGYRRR